MNLGENIREARKAAGVTQKELAEYLDVYQKDISRWENGEQIPNAITFAKSVRRLERQQIKSWNYKNEKRVK